MQHLPLNDGQVEKSLFHGRLPLWDLGGSNWDTRKSYPLSQNDYRQEKIIFELFLGALQENPVRAPGAIT